MTPIEAWHAGPIRQHLLTLEVGVGIVPKLVDIETSARKHGVTDDDVVHALRNHWQAFETDDPDVR